MLATVVAHLEMRLEAKLVGAAPGEAVALCQGLQTHPRHWHPAPWLGLAASPITPH